MLRVHYFNVIFTGMHFLKSYFYEFQVNIKEKHLQKKKVRKNFNAFFIAALLHFYDLDLTKSQLSNKIL